MQAKTQQIAALVVFTMLLVEASNHACCGQQRNDRRSAMRGFFNSGIMSLFRIPEVQAELNLTREEAELIFALQADLFSEYRNARRGGGAEDGLPTADEVSEKSGQVAEHLLSAILRPRQYKRLQELWLQRRGLRAITSDQLADALELDPQQREITTELAGKLSQNYGRLPVSEEDATIAKQITDTLTTKQRDKWETMLGKTFDFRSASAR